MAPALRRAGVAVVLIYIHEAHSSAWPVGLPDQPEPHACYADRVRRACAFRDANPGLPYPLYLDTWGDAFEQRYRAWPDHYYLVEAATGRLQAQSTYAHVRGEALVDEDLAQLLARLLREAGEPVPDV